MNDDHPCRVLVMDDAPDLLRQVQESLATGAGHFQIDGTGTGAEALIRVAEACAGGRPYGLIFAAPGPAPARHGLQTVARVREEHPMIEVVVCGDGADSWEELAAILNCRDRWLFLKKPLEPAFARQLALFLAQKWNTARRSRIVSESFAHLAGGMAHDFNNILTVISGHARMLPAGSGAGGQMSDAAREISRAVKRAGDLTRQLTNLGRRHELHSQADEQPALLPVSSGGQKNIGGVETILMVDAEAPLLRLMRHILESCGYNVHDSSSGNTALEIWAQHKNKIDLLLSDLTLPGGMAGPELAKILQAEKPGLKVVYTASSDPAQQAGVFPPGQDAVFLEKPFHARKLAETVFDTLHRK